MRAFVLFHADMDDDRYVRGVFSTKEAAQAMIDQTEPCRYHMDEEHRLYYGKQGSADQWTCSSARNHGEDCCDVEEYEMDELRPRVVIEQEGLVPA